MLVWRPGECAKTGHLGLFIHSALELAQPGSGRNIPGLLTPPVHMTGAGDLAHLGGKVHPKPGVFFWGGAEFSLLWSGPTVAPGHHPNVPICTGPEQAAWGHLGPASKGPSGQALCVNMWCAELTPSISLPCCVYQNRIASQSHRNTELERAIESI